MKKVVIIGGGIAGLTAGIFAQKNGFESVILEKHHTLGGECTGWDRQGYHIDGCIHWLMGTKEGTPINELWKTVGALGEDVEIHHLESFLTYEHEDGQQVHLYRDLEHLRSSWIEISPEDKETIDEFCDTVKKLQSFEIPVGKPMNMMNPIEKIKLMLSMKDAGMVMQKYGKISLSKYADNFKHPALRNVLATFVPDGSSYSASSVFFALAGFTKGQASVPAGGSKALAMRMQERYLSLGGKIETRCEVVDLDIQANQVKGVVCSNGKEFQGDYYIAAIDAHFFYEKLLKGRFPDKKFKMRFETPEVYPVASELRISIGFEGTTSEIPRTLRFPVKAPFKVNGTIIDRLQLTNYSYEPSFAPDGHTLFSVTINQHHEEYDAWDALAKDKEAYRREKERIAQEVIGAIETRFPHTKGKLKLLDVATPKTFERYCNSYRGGIVGFVPTVGARGMDHSGQVKGLKNLLLSGQWLMGAGGLPPALITGKNSIYRICKQEKREFIAQ